MLPNSWKRVILKDLATLCQYGATVSGLDDNTGTRLIRITDITDDGKILNYGKKYARLNALELKTYRLGKGDFLIARSGSIGRTLLWDFDNLDAVFASYLIRIKIPDEKINKQYFNFLLKSNQFRNYASTVSTGATLANINSGHILRFSFPLPPLLEQERIVMILEQAEKIRNIQKEAQAKAREILATIFKEMFLRHPDRDKWQVTTVGKAGEVQLGRQRSPQYQTGRNSKPYLRVANVLDDEFDLSEETSILEMDFDAKDFERYRLEYGDILLVEGHGGDGLGRSAMWREHNSGICYQNHLIRFRILKNSESKLVLPEYALAVFQNYYREGVFDRISPDADLPSLGTVRFSRLPFVIPPEKLQREFLKRLEVAQNIFRQFEFKNLQFSNGISKITAAAFAGTLTQKWREQPNTAAQLEQQAKARDALLARKTSEIVEDDTSDFAEDTSDFLPSDDLSNTNLRAGFASHVFKQLRDNQKIRLQTSEDIKPTQYIDAFLRIVDLELQPHTEKTMLETPSRIVGLLQKSEDPTLQEMADTLSNIDLTTRAEFNPNNPRHPRAFFWQEVTENSPLRIVYNAFRISQQYNNFQTITQTLEDLNEALEGHRIARAIDTLKSAGLIEAVVLQMPSPSSLSETVLVSAYRLPELEAPKFALLQESP